MKILITGGFGFLGGRVAQFLSLQSNHEVILGSRSCREPPDWLMSASVVQTLWNSWECLDRVCYGVDAIVHMAGMSASDCVADPVSALEFNGVATARLLQAAIKNKVKRFLYISTAHVYASPLAGKITEEFSPKSLHPYATSNRAGEDVVQAAHQRRDIEGIVIRLSNVYGMPTCKNVNCWMLLVNDLCRQVVTTQKMVLKSAGLQRRNFVPISDVCRAIGHLLQLAPQKIFAGIFNLGGDWNPTVRDVASYIQDCYAELSGIVSELTGHFPSSESEKNIDLDYRSDFLEQSGFQFKASRRDEIDQLLKFCKVFT